MKKYLLKFLLTLPIIFVFGCSSSEKTSDAEQRPQSEVTETIPPVPDTENTAKVDTLDVQIENNTKVAYETTTSNPPATPVQKPIIKNNMGNFSIQIGAFQAEENSLQYAYIAKNKLDIDTYNIFDKGINLFRVIVGSFETKEAAHQYRDQLVKKFPEYKDAWVIDTNKELKR
jgi:cell division septation protein DedD